MSSTRFDHPLQDKVDGFLEDRRIRAGARILVACSGGPDSTALLHALAAVAPRRGLGLLAAYFDHGIRGPSEREAERRAVSALATELSVELSAGRARAGEIETLARAEGRSLEEVARSRRRLFLLRTADSLDADFVALGHTTQDDLETLIMRFFQGSGLRGLRGLPGRSGRVLRPLIACSRAEVLSYVQSQGLRCHEDASNKELRFLRNRVRSELLPVVERLFRGYGNALRRLEGKMRAATEALDAQLRRDVDWEPLPDHDGLRIEIDRFEALSPALRVEALYEAVARLASGPYEGARIPHGFVLEGVRAIGRRSGPLLLRGRGVRLTRSTPYLVVEKDVVSNVKKGYFSVVDETQDPESTGLRVAVPRSDGRRDVFLLEKSAVSPPLVIRSRKPGDSLSTPAGTRSLKRLVNEWGVADEFKDDVAVLEDRRGVVAIIGSPLDAEKHWAVRAQASGAAAMRGSKRRGHGQQQQ